MMTEVMTKQQLAKALLTNAGDIHVVDEKLALGILTRPKKHRFVLYAMQANGYKMTAVKCLGMFDVKFIKE